MDRSRDDTCRPVARGPDGALTAQEPRLATVLGDDEAAGGSPRSSNSRAVTAARRADVMRPAASGELDARERGVVVGCWSAERAASWPTAAHKCATSALVSAAPMCTDLMLHVTRPLNMLWTATATGFRCISCRCTG